MINGVIPVNKPKEWTSFDVVSYVRRILKNAEHSKERAKVGHLGTLDPLATGVLLVTINKATRLFDIMQQKKKTYLATFKFGMSTDTLDITGVVENVTQNIPTVEQIKEIIPQFIGDIMQVPPIYSAKSVNGERAYNLARQGKKVELAPKKVTIYSIEFINYANDELTLQIECGSGTYIRALGRDIASKLNSYACMTSLVRTKIDNFDLQDCYNIKDVSKKTILDKIIPINKLLDMPVLEVEEQICAKLLNGQKIKISNLKDGLYKLNKADNTVAIVEVAKNLCKMKIFLD